MALGGGDFVTQNKALPGAYINFVSSVSASATLADRGIATMPLSLDWGVDGAVFKVEMNDFLKNSLQLFGYKTTDAELKGIRDIFKTCHTLYAYRLNSGVKAENDIAVAKYSGIRGNDLSIRVQIDVDDEEKFEVSTLLGTYIYDTQVVSSSADLVGNDWVDFKENDLTELNVAIPLTGGENGEETVESHINYLAEIERFSYNVMGVVTESDDIKSMYASFVKRMRDEVGSKFQLVLHKYSADYEGIVNVKNDTTDTDWSVASLVYWVTGRIGGCAINQSNTNYLYDGSFAVNTIYTQAELASSLTCGEFVLHQVGDDVRVLEDLNSLLTLTETKGELFQDNQTIRVIDQIANDIAVLFTTKYLGVIQNDDGGRISLWADIVKHHEELGRMRAIENFDENDVVVTQGNTKKEVVVSDAVTVVNAMNKLYMTVTVS